MALWLGSLVGVDQKGAARTEAAVDTVTAKGDANASVAQWSATVAESLLDEVAKLSADVRILRKAVGYEKVAEARESIARPNVRKERSWWQRLTGQGG